MNRAPGIIQKPLNKAIAGANLLHSINKYHSITPTNSVNSSITVFQYTNGFDLTGLDPIDVADGLIIDHVKRNISTLGKGIPSSSDIKIIVSYTYSC